MLEGRKGGREISCNGCPTISMLYCMTLDSLARTGPRLLSLVSLTSHTALDRTSHVAHTIRILVPTTRGYNGGFPALLGPWRPLKSTTRPSLRRLVVARCAFPSTRPPTHLTWTSSVGAHQRPGFKSDAPLHLSSSCMSTSSPYCSLFTLPARHSDRHVVDDRTLPYQVAAFVAVVAHEQAIAWVHPG